MRRLERRRCCSVFFGEAEVEAQLVDAVSATSSILSTALEGAAVTPSVGWLFDIPPSVDGRLGCHYRGRQGDSAKNWVSQGGVGASNEIDPAEAEFYGRFASR